MPLHASLTAPTERLADDDITAAVERFIFTKKGMTTPLIDVATHDGIVELTGFAGTLLERERATALAQAVRGVRGVINEVVVRATDVPDAALLSAVEAALSRDPATTGYNVRCHASSGEVTVEGAVQSWAEQQLVLQALRGVRGVTAIRNRLDVHRGEITNTDAEITIQIRELLDWDIRVQSELVSIRTAHGVVHLAGTVGTPAERDFVVATAYQAGATHVNARDLFVARWALDKALRREKFVLRADEDVAQAVRDALRLDPRVRAFGPTVRVRDGVATLAGAVSNLLAQQAAERDAENIVGVREVHNLLQVETHYPAPDAATQQHIKAALACDAYVGPYTFTVNVSNGKVQLYGTVNAHFEQERAADVAAGVTGVVTLDNHVQAGPAAASADPISAPADGHPEPDYALEQRLRSHYYWSALLHDQDVDIRVHEGRVTLLGTVDTHWQRRVAAQHARACGARDVNNHLRLASWG
ncbi:BON domain-containing protein [Hymenobacter jeollabukensis]|uniref:BON domain-containing protein n=1 Tax=Hymenobacter jeollabukensis TaxID=2025313 RepID=A0A5R8WVB9_9BACT|nr:BON domain-containing protein [Hymenobacter jeollabukensis]TLM96470.1 BON domain-containing protein [Hymenobacter jeollabukensis]